MRRRGLMANKLYDAQVEYIETDGEAFIDTGVIMDSNLKFDISFYEPVTSVGNIVFGGRTNTHKLEFAVGNDSGMWAWRYRTVTKSKDFDNYQHSGNYIVNNIPYPYLINFTCDETFHYLNSSATAYFTLNLSFTIFASHASDGVSVHIPGVRLYYCKLYNGDNLVRDFIPVRKKGKGYLYDKVTDALFGNAASVGAFTYGNDVTQ